MADITALKDIIKELRLQKFDDDNSIRYEDVEMLRPDDTSSLYYVLQYILVNQTVTVPVKYDLVSLDYFVTCQTNLVNGVIPYKEHAYI